MNVRKYNILNMLASESYINQRDLSESTGYSLGIVNRILKELSQDGYISKDHKITEKTFWEYKKNSPRRAIILAAGFGMRMVPINTQIPKGLLEVRGEPLIERTIKQLHEVGIEDIYIVVGFLKEQYEYLIDEYGVKLIVNENYFEKNNLFSLKLVADYLDNSYVIPCDIWCEKNPYHKYEMYSWYLLSDLLDKDSNVRVNRKLEVLETSDLHCGNKMIGICYLTEGKAKIVRERMIELCNNRRYHDSFWEKALYQNGKMIVAARIAKDTEIVEINTYEQLRELDCDCNQLQTDAMQIITKALNVNIAEIVDITLLKKGMTNRSFLFSCKGKQYIMRIPGEGTEQLINRRNEAAVYQAIDGKSICDEIIYINSDNGYKISEYMKNARVCDPFETDDVLKSIKYLRNFHEMKLKVDHEFDIFAQLEFYESLWNGVSSVYRDYITTKNNVFELKKYIDKCQINKVLTHIDAVPDNFLFVESKDGISDIRLIDWEYASMQDPHLDIAMFCIYSLYNREQVDNLIDLYFIEECTNTNRIKIYCYISVCGLLWSNWCEYKRNLRIEFGEYSLRQYRYAKEYYKIVQEELKKYMEGENE